MGAKESEQRGMNKHTLIIAMPSLAHIHDAEHAQRECRW